MAEARAKVAVKGHAKVKSTRSAKRRCSRPGPARVGGSTPAIAAAVALLPAAFQVYAPALSGPFVFDDTFQPYRTPGFPTCTLSAWITRRSAAADVQLLAQLPDLAKRRYGFHAANVLIHLLNSFLIFCHRAETAHSRESSDWLLPAFAASGFPAASHPDRIGVLYRRPVGSLERSSSSWRPSPSSYTGGRPRSPGRLGHRGAGCCSAPRSLTKEHTLVLPALLLLTDYYWNPGFSFSGIRRNWRLYVPIALGAAGGWFSWRRF
jgi:protein O-mannosyl-transferase